MPSNSLNIREPESDNPSPSDGLLKMNTPLRDELREILFKASGGISDMANEEIDQILSLVASKMPEKKETRATNKSLGIRMDALHEGWNAYHDSVKSILKGGTDE